MLHDLRQALRLLRNSPGFALGADRARVLREVLASGARLAALGVAGGLLAAFGATRWLAAQLYQVTPTDPATFAGVAGTFVLVALAACLLPARRAAKTDPLAALRSE